jgi:hypothetical protein
MREQIDMELIEKSTDDSIQVIKNQVQKTLTLIEQQSMEVYGPTPMKRAKSFSLFETPKVDFGPLERTPSQVLRRIKPL